MLTLKALPTWGSAIALLGWGASGAAAFGLKHAAVNARLAEDRAAALPDSASPPRESVQLPQFSAVSDGPAEQRSALPQYRQAMDNAHDLQYFAKLQLGPQELNVVLDTGSVEFVVLSDKCEYWCGPEGRLFHINQSSSYVHGNLNLILSYGSGELLGMEAYDNVRIGHWMVANTAFWEVRDASMPLLFQADWSAIIGLGPMKPNTKVMELHGMHNKQSFAVLPKKLGIDRFGICLGKEPGSQGYITWNDQSPALIPGDFVKLRVIDTGYWMLKLTDVYVGDRYLACNRGCGVVADSGTSLLSLPVEQYNNFKAIIAGMHADCSHLSVLPDLHFKLDGHPFSLPADAYVGNVYGSKMKALEGKHAAPQLKSRQLSFGEDGEHEATSKEQAKCEPAIMHISMESSVGPVWILGMPFFRKYYSVFVQRSEESGPALHVATATNDCGTASSSQQGLLGPTANRSQREREVDSASSNLLHGHRAREVDMSKVQVPAWARRAHKLGRLEETEDMSRTIGSPEEILPQWNKQKGMAT